MSNVPEISSALLFNRVVACWAALVCCLSWVGCRSVTFYPVRYHSTATSSQCDGVIKLFISDVTATGAIDDGGILLQSPNGSLHRDKSKEWRDLPTKLFRQAMLSASLTKRWNQHVTIVSNPAQADIAITVHLREFWVAGDGEEDPTAATAGAVVQFAPTCGEPSSEVFNKYVKNPGRSIENLYSLLMGQAVTNLVNDILARSCEKEKSSRPPAKPPKVATILAWDPLLNRDVGVVITLGADKAGTISIRDRFAAPIVEWNIMNWKFDATIATFNIEHPWNISGATIEVVEEEATENSTQKNSTTKGSKKEEQKKGRLLLRFKKIPGMQELELREQTKEEVVEELRGL